MEGGKNPHSNIHFANNPYFSFISYILQFGKALVYTLQKCNTIGGLTKHGGI